MKNNIKTWLKHEWAFIGLLVVFAFESSWLAITSSFQMAFDEAWHFGLINFYAHHLNPFVTSQAASTFSLGAIPHNPSFLYHYLMSFPFRLSTYLTSDPEVQIIFLRFINIGLAIASLILIRQILLRLHFTRAISNITVFLLGFTPIFSVLAAQVNYDNMLITATAGCIFTMLVFVTRLGEGRFDLWIFGCQIGLLFMASVIKFEFLPIMFGIILVNTWFIVQFWRKRKGNFWTLVKRSFKRLRRWQVVFLISLNLLGGGLFTTYYGYDMVVYHNVNPSCDQILPIKACQQYYSWNRNYTLFTNKDDSVPLMNPVSYTLLWAKSAYYQLFAEIIPTGGLVPIDGTFYRLIIVLTVTAVLCALYQVRTIFRKHRYLPVVLFIYVIYLFALWARNYHDYLRLGQVVAVQGRYILPAIVYLYGFLALGVWYSLSHKGRIAAFSRALVGLAVVTIFLVFGGFNRYRTEISPKTHWTAASINYLKDTANKY